MVDVSPELLKAVQTSFRAKIAASKYMEAWKGKIGAGKATYYDAADYAYEVGSALADAFGARISSEMLPDGRMYQNIAENVVAPMLRESHAMISEAAAQVQEEMNKAAGLGIRAQSVPLDSERVQGMVNKLANANTFEAVAWVLNEPVKTFAQSVVDDTLRANVDFQGKAGLRPKIVRRAGSKCCEWCSRLDGAYTYPDVPHDVYRRHERCRCLVEYDPRDGKRQNIWTKQWKATEQSDKIKARNTIGDADTARPLRILRGSGGGLGDKGGTVHEFLGSVNPNDTETIKKLQSAFCKQYASSPVENMMVITKDGEVHFMTDNNPRGVDCTYLGKKLKGSYNIHTHPPDSTQFSFSTDVDIPGAFMDGTSVMEAVDYKYRYRFEVPADITFETWDKVRYGVWQTRNELFNVSGLDVSEYDENIQDLILQETCRRIGISCYRRWSNG